MSKNPNPRMPPWFTTAWLEQLASGPVAADLAQLDGRLALPASWDTGQRSLETWLWYRLDQGAMFLAWEGSTATVAAGQIALIPANLPFRARSIGGGCRLDRCRLALPKLQADRAAPLIAPLVYPSLADLLIALAADRQAALRERRISAALLACLAPLLDRPAAGPTGLNTAQQADIAAWTIAHIHRRPEPADLAHLCGLSPDYFARLFSAAYGRSPRTWLLEERLRLVAVALRESDQGLDDLARSFGYADQNLMGRQFRRRYGCSPGAYRRQGLRPGPAGCDGRRRRPCG